MAETMEKIKKAKVPIILQLEEMEGGAACLTMILAYYKKWIRLDRVREACGISRDGIQPETLAAVAKEYGLACRQEEISLPELSKRKDVPAILLWETDQYVVLRGIGKKGIYINHPTKGELCISVAQFEKCYEGICLFMSPGENFVCEGKKVGIHDYIIGFIRDNTRTVVLLMLTGVIATIGGVVAPAFYRVFTDDIMTKGWDSWYPEILFVFILVILYELIAGMINQLILIRSRGKVSAVSNARYMRHIFRLPMGFFQRRKAGDLSGRQEANDLISETFINQLAPQLMNLALVILYILIMIDYSVTLTIVGVVAIVVNLLLMRKIGSIRRRINGVQYRCKANLNSITVSGVDMIETIKATGSENAFLERWGGYHASMINAQVRSVKATRFLANVPALITALSQDIVMFVGFLLIIRGYFTAGMLLTFFQFMKSVNNPVSQLVEAGENLEAMGAAIDRVNDVIEYPEEKTTEAKDSEIDFSTVEKLSGSVELKNISFGYARFGDPLIEDFSLTLTPGKRIALVGGSGSGKSTIAKMIVGLQKPWSGEILYDGQRLDEIPKALFKSSVAMVDQDVVLFHDTIENNVKMWDTTIDNNAMLRSARDAGILEEIRTRRGGFQMMVEPGGRNLSGGERQRIEIARVLATDPSILILDEATSALDAKTEYEISELINQRKITCIIVAHRLSTIRDCDEIIVMDRGRVVQRGTHDELMANEGLYKKLIMTA